MVTASQPFTSIEDYLIGELRGETKSEYLNGMIIPMSGASLEHNRIQRNLLSALTHLLKGSNYEALGSDMRVFNPKNKSYFYPDLSVVEGEPQLSEDKFDNLLNPCLIVEILSPATSSYDKGTKFTFYRSIPTLREYILVDQSNIHIEFFYKNEKDRWELQEFEEIDQTILLLNNFCPLRIADIYDKVKLSH